MALRPAASSEHSRRGCVRMSKVIRSVALSAAVVALGFTTPLSTHAATSRFTTVQSGGATNGPISGGFTVTQVPANAVPAQLVTGTDGSVWFLNAKSQLGTVSSSGQATLTGVTFPAGAELISAGPEGEWAYSNAGLYQGPCTVELAEPGGHVLSRTPGHPPDAYCDGGARDSDGDLWVTLNGHGSNGMAEITPAGVFTVTYAVVVGSVALGSDGAMWTFVRGYQFGRFVPGQPPTLSKIFADGTPPVTGSAFGGVRYFRSDLLPRPDGTFWLESSQATVLSSPGNWYTRFNFSGYSDSAVTPDGDLWNVGYGPGNTTLRVERLDNWGVIDRSAGLPVSPRNGKPLSVTGPLTALPDGSVLFGVTDGPNNFLIRYVPTQIPAESVWTGTAGGGLWSTPGNWLNNAVPQNGSIIVLRGAGAMTDNLPGLQPDEILAYGTFHLSGDALTLGTYGIQASGYTTNGVIDDSISVAAGTTLTVRADPYAAITLGGVISGAGGIETPPTSGLSAGLVELSANNTYTGSTLVESPLRIDGDQPGSAVDDESQLFGGGTTGPLTVSGTLGFNDEAVSSGICPQTLTVDGNLVFTSSGGFEPAIEACGSPSAQTIGSVLVTGTVTLNNAGMSLWLNGDKPQLACLLSSKGAFSGQFDHVKQGSTEPDPSGGKVVFSYDTPGGAGCYANAFTATTGVH
jgi:hypothetical protein